MRIKKRDYSNWERNELIEEIEHLRKQKTYGLVFDREKVKEEFDYFMNFDEENLREIFKEKNKFPVLKSINEKDIFVDGENRKTNVLIEGDNFHSLIALNFTHKERIDTIYIDPPYNTGNKDFRYNDKFIDKEDQFRHSKWLNFMEKRLRLSRKLLKNSGSIWISIGTDEFAQLKLLCDEIFGENNFLGNIIVKSNPRGKQQMFIPETHEYLLVYARDINKLQFKGLKLTESKIKEYNKTDKNGKRYREMGLRKRGAASRRVDVPNLFYPIYVNPKNGEVSLERDNIYTEEAIPVLSDGVEGRWRWSKKKFLLDKNQLYGRTVNNGDRWDIFQYDYLENGDDNNQKMIKPNSIWDEKEINYENAKKELKNMFNGESPFDYPKTTFLLKKIIDFSCPNNGIILDFFAGSGTCGQAVLELNNEDNETNRSFILCTNNEISNDIESKFIKKNSIKNIDIWKHQNLSKWDEFVEKSGICSTVTLPRLKKVITGYTSKDGENIEGTGGELKYFKTSFVDAEITDQNKRKLVNLSTDLICLREGCYKVVENNEDFKIYKNSNYYLGIIFEDDCIEDFVEFVKENKINSKIKVYSFTLDGSLSLNEFGEIKDNIKLFPIPDVILNIYKRVMKNV